MIVKEILLAGYKDRDVKGCTCDKVVVVKKSIDENGKVVNTKFVSWHAGDLLTYDDDGTNSITECENIAKLKNAKGEREQTAFCVTSKAVTKVEREWSYYRDINVTVLWEHGWAEDGDFVYEKVIGMHGGKSNEKTFECIGQLEF